MVPFEIRNAMRADAEAIAGLLTELNREEANDVMAHGDAMARALFGDSLPVDVHALVAVSEGDIIGVVLYYAGYDTLSDSYGHHLADIIVTKEQRGRGVGRALMQALSRITLEGGKEWISLTALKRNATAQEFYKALGMTQVDVHFFAAGKNALAQL